MEKKPQHKLKLGYWKSRGRAQIARLILAYNDVDFEDVLYSDPDKWFKNDKQSLGLDFPNLPYLIDDNTKIKLT